MRIKDIARAKKIDVACDDWKSGRMPKSLFPLGKSGKNALSFRGGYDWCSLRFKALSCEFRMVVAVHLQKQEYYAHLGRAFGGDTQMLASYEFHGTHPGWHVHAGCGDTTVIPVGRYKGPWRTNIPRSWETCRRKDWDVDSKEAALKKACELFGVPTSTRPGGQMVLV